jgi:type III secretion protein T
VLQEAVRYVDLALLLGLSVLRVSMAFIVLPIFSPEMIPPTVRNSIFIGLAVICLAMQPGLVPLRLGISEWLALAGKEALIGLAIGFFAGSMLWAMESVGYIIDTKSGASMAQILDPIGGHQSTPLGQFFSRLAVFVFMFSGGLLLLVGSIVESFAIWPVASNWPAFKPGAYEIFEAEFGRLLMIAVMFSAPAILVLFLIDAGLGLINRYAQQINLIALQMPIKMMAALLVTLMMMGLIVDRLVAEFTTRPGLVLQILKRIFQTD